MLTEMKNTTISPSISFEALKLFCLFFSFFFYFHVPLISAAGPTQPLETLRHFSSSRQYKNSDHAVSTTAADDGHNDPNASAAPPVQLNIHDQHVVIDNGIIGVTLSNPKGMVTGIQYKGIENLLHVSNSEDDRGYWDIVWNVAGSPGTKGIFDRIEATEFKVILENDEQIELSFSRTYNSSMGGDLIPLNIDKRFVMLRNSSGFYSYAIYEHLKEWPAFIIDNTRIVFKPRKDKFRYMAVADTRQRFMPLPDDRKPPRGEALAYPEAVLLVDPVEPEFKGEVDDKYQYGCESKDSQVHGWISTDPPIGFWQIAASEEFRSGGPIKQFLTSHVGPTILTVFHSAHYAGEDMVIKFGSNEPWKKVFGPIFFYLNSLPEGEDPLRLWQNAIEQMTAEVQSWPYSFPASEDFLKSDQRGTVSGRLLVRERYVSDESMPASGAYVGLALPGELGSWQTESKGYQFWTRADENGHFSLNNVHSGNYSLYGWIPNFIGNYQYNAFINVTPGSDINVGDLVFEPPRDGPTLWEIGIPDRTAAEFYVPDPNPKYINKLYVNHSDRFRQYGLWERYTELYPNEDLVYTVGLSDYRKDWFFAQVTRKIGDNQYAGTTWKIKFQLDSPDTQGTYRLRLALATAHAAELQVRLNDAQALPPLFTTGLIGKDNTIARHGIHGLYRLYTVDIPGSELVVANNTILLTQTSSNSPFVGIMYDYLRLEGPLTSKIYWKSSARTVVGFVKNGKRDTPIGYSGSSFMDNGILQVTLSKPDGNVTGIKYNSLDNVLEVDDKEAHRGYWDLVWNAGISGTTGTFDQMRGKEFEVIVQNEEQIELSFKRNYSFKDKAVPLNIDKRFIMLRSSSGFYSYAIYEHLKEWPPFNLPETRIVFKLRKDKFHYMTIADNRHRFMPLPEDRLRHRGKPLDFPEAVLLVNPKEPEFKGEVDDKYQYSCESKDLKVHGWISMDPPVGFWQITPSSEFRSGGPLKQNLTSHVGPYTLAMFLSAHYAGEDLVLKLNPDEPWKKVFGPVFFYLNSVSDGGDPLPLWEDAKTQMTKEVQSWPYSFPASEDFPPPNQRGRLTGKLFVHDRYVNQERIPATDAYVGLAAPGDAGSWQTENKGYQFWTKTATDGSFSIENIRIGDYNLYAWVPGFIGDYRYDVVISVSAGSDMDVGDLVYEPPRNGPTLWEIGIPDRSAAEFYVPDPDPKYINKLYVNHPDRFRQYGLWEKYAELYPDADLVYTVGVSDYTKDWFFAHVTRRRNDGSHLATTWEIKFTLDNVIDQSGTFTLRVALATANVAELRVNNPEAKPALFTTGLIGHDNAIARHGIHGLYRLYHIDISGSLLVEGENTIFLSQIINSSSFNGVMYDYIRLEGPPSIASTYS